MGRYLLAAIFVLGAFSDADASRLQSRISPAKTNLRQAKNARKVLKQRPKRIVARRVAPMRSVSQPAANRLDSFLQKNPKAKALLERAKALGKKIKILSVRHHLMGLSHVYISPQGGLLVTFGGNTGFRLNAKASQSLNLTFGQLRGAILKRAADIEASVKVTR
jgi:hypothetical protein